MVIVSNLSLRYGKRVLFDEVNLKFTEDALKAIAAEAIKRRSGARGLRAILEDRLLDIMFELPSMKDICECIINADVIMNKAKPIIIYQPTAKSA